jgi:hypothetical protein
MCPSCTTRPTRGSIADICPEYCQLH